jgi:signal transduction histidine kinase
VLDDFGLIAALERLVRDVRTRTDVEASLQLLPADCPPVCRLARELEVALYRIAQEALNNCLKHAAASEICMTLELTDDRLQLRIADDGRGYIAAIDETIQETNGLGLLGMRERLRPWHGHVDVRAGAAGGTEVVAEVVVASAE